MSSLFEFSTSSGFRKRLLTRNLTPYAKAPNRPTLPIDTEYIQTDSSVIDSPDQLIDTPTFANQLYPLNQWGSEGGYKQVPDPNGLTNTKSNQGEYGPGQQDAKILEQALPESYKWKPVNAYSNGSERLLDSGEYITLPDFIVGGTNLYNNQPYPTTFVPSSYAPVTILLSNDPLGTNGLLSQDSFIAKLGAQTLRKSFEERIATQIVRNTIGRANVFNVDSGNDLLNLITGRVPLLEPNWTITVPSNPILAATDFALRLAGSILPVSPIPGSYWDTSINPGQPTTIQQLQNAFRRTQLGNFFNRLLGAPQTGSQLFLNNTGAGQKSRLFANIDFNKYKPNYDRTFFDRVAGALTGGISDNSNYYVGSRNAEPSQVFSPPGALPVNQFGVVQQSPVFGPTELAQLYEGPSKDVRLGANGPTYSDGGGIEGGLTWVSPKYKGNAGKRVGLGGEVTNEDQDFRPSSYNSTESTERTFREGSILDDTQRIIDSQPQGGKRLQHVGNAIDQVSKVFNDGYKEMTKGSRVYRYEGAPGQEVGTEYCRVFTKDIPYLQYNDLQKTDGITTEGRRFSYSVLDKTYNLNIAPNKQEGGVDSTNIVGTVNNGYAKKYMFSLENLAWRTSSTPGFSVSDLPICERGPNGGRVMWFPPYGLTFNESVTTSWSQNDFIGRPEPIYTYKNTSRGGSLSWKIVVDHPSVLNVIVNKILTNETNRTRVNSIIESFFAGCRKYDLYELAKKYYTVNPNDLFQLQEAITSKKVTKEQTEWIKQTIQTGVDGGQGQNVTQSTTTTVNLNDKYGNKLGFYFANDYPKQGDVSGYTSQYLLYIGQKSTYQRQPKSAETINFFNTVVEPNFKLSETFINDIDNVLTTNNTGSITVYVSSSCSAPATQQYNKELAQRRIDSVLKYLSGSSKLSKFIENKRLLFKPGIASGENASAQVLQIDQSGKQTIGPVINCTDKDINVKGGDTQSGTKDIYTYASMSCRRAVITKIEDKTSRNVPSTTPVPQYTDVLIGNTVTTTQDIQEVSREWKPRDNITKRILRSLLSECDYFETIKAESPMVYDNLKDKLKYFQPAFHSMTPEGLNSRLTFLQQCMRPGDTIPTIKNINGSTTLQYNNATNTSFGAPPVLVLRIGDFYNTKIIPTNLTLNFEELDLNPEGIGVQPMIANVQLQFNFVGGSGLKESVDKLQNALTFNYYANTEIYDDRADSTFENEYLKTLDSEFLAMAVPPSPPAINQAPPNNGQTNNQTIGTILSKTVTDLGETGTTSYSEFMVNFVNQTQTYFQNVVNTQREITSQYNNAVRQQWMKQRNYTDGSTYVSNDSTILFGKPNNVEKTFDSIFKKLQEDIEANNDEFIKFIDVSTRNFSRRAISTIKTNYINYVRNKRGVFENALTKKTQDFVNLQTQYIQTWSRANILTFDNTFSFGTDGFQSPNGNVTVYTISGTPEVDKTSQGADTLVELVNDIKKVTEGITEFNTITFRKNSFVYPGDSKKYEGVLVYEVGGSGMAIDAPETIEVFNPFSTNELFTSLEFRRQYMIMSDDVLDDKKYQTFKNAILGNVKGNADVIGSGNPNVEEAFDSYWIGKAKPLFKEENDITKSFLDSVEKNELKNFIIYTPFNKKTRVFTFSNENSEDDPTLFNQQKNMIISLNAQKNTNNNKYTWNDDISGTLISKAKLN